MALTKQGYMFLGFTFDAYVKIIKFEVSEAGSDELGKLYDVKLTVRFYTSATKENGFDTQEHTIPGMRAADLNIKSAYEALKSTKTFSGCVDA